MSKARDRHEELLILLHQMMRQGRGQGARADEIGDEMSLLWHQLDDEERDLFDELSEDLYLIEGKRFITPLGEGEAAESVLRQMAQAYKEGRDRETLALARKGGAHCDAALRIRPLLGKAGLQAWRRVLLRFRL